MEQSNVIAVVTTYKREPEVVAKAVDSILNQTCPVTEVLVVDDNQIGSDFSRKLEMFFRNYSDRVRYIKQRRGNGNCGACAARNLGIENAKGEYICFLDDDDYWLPAKVEKQLRAFDDGVGLVYCCGIVEETTDDGVKTYDYITKKTFKAKVTHLDMLRRDHVGSTSNPMIRATCFQECGVFNEEMPARQDYEMWLRISEKYIIRGVEEQLFVHTLHQGEQISRNSQKVIIGYKKIMERYKDEYKKDPEAMYIKTRRLAAMLYRNKKIEFLRYCVPMAISRMKMIVNRKMGK